MKSQEQLTASSCLTLWSNGKVSFEDILKQYAAQHVANALHAAEQSGFALSLDDDQHFIIHDVYPVSKIV